MVQSGLWATHIVLWVGEGSGCAAPIGTTSRAHDGDTRALRVGQNGAEFGG